MSEHVTNAYELGRRAVACAHWRWMPGMRALVGPMNAPYRYLTPEYAPPEGDRVGFCDPMPDLSDPATLGCLLALVQEAWNACRISVCFSAYTPDATKRWSVPISFFRDQRDLVNVPSFYGTTQAEALVAALEAAP